LGCKKEFIDVGVFPWNLNNTDAADINILSGALPIIQSITTSYTICLQGEGGNSITIAWEYPAGTSAGFAFQIPVAGIFNGRNYYVFVDGSDTFFLWYDAPNLNWQVSNALGGGNDYLNSVNSGTTTCPPSGELNVEWLDGSNPLFTEFKLTNCQAICLNQPFTFNIYEYCNKWDNYEFVFMDKKNCWVPMNFELVQRKNVGLDRKTFKKGLEYNYGYLDRGETVVQNIITYNYTITSNWFDEATSLYFEELMTSPEVYWNYEGTGEFIPINLNITNQEIKDKRNTRLIQYTLQFQYSNNPIGMLG
jgi:hypothetical protein